MPDSPIVGGQICLRAILLLVGLFAAGRSEAQALLYAERGGQFLPVVRFEGDQPRVLVGEELKSASRFRYALRPMRKYNPSFVKVSEVKVTVRYGGDGINKEIDFKADVESSFPLPNVFIVFEMNRGELMGREVGDLVPREPKRISLRIPLDNYPDSNRYTVRVFSNGPEVFSSMMPIGGIDREINQMIKEKLGEVQNAGPQPLVGPKPLYPKALLKKGLRGSATVAFTVRRNGSIKDPVVQDATDPAFGQAALESIREWYFVPKVVDGVRVESQVTLPFAFVPPKS